MSKVVVITDSTAYLPPALVEKYHIPVCPLFVIWGNENYRDGIDIQPAEFYHRLKTAKTIPTSSQVPVNAFVETYRQYIDAGDSVLAMTLSSKFSGTYESAIQAKAQFPGAPIEVIDTMSAGLGAGLQVLSAARAADAGARLAECKEVGLRARQNSGLLIVVDTLEFLHRGGRIGGGARFLGTALNIKPLLEVQDGRLEALERVRTRAKALNRLIELIGERSGGRKPLRLACMHANAEADAHEVVQRAAQQFGAVETLVSPVSPVIGVHVGPGTIGLAYLAEL